MNPDNAHYAYNFSIGSETFSLALFFLHKEDWPEILTPLLLQKVDGVWQEIGRYDSLWTDIQEELGEEYLANSIVNMFNKILEKFNPGGALTFNQKLIAIFQLRLALDKNQLVLKPA